MRFDTVVYFQQRTPGGYNAKTGNYEPCEIYEFKEYADVSNTSERTLNLVYGEIREGSLTVRVLRPVTTPFDRLRIGDKIYRVDSMRKLRTKQIFVISEVQGDAEIKD